MTYFPEFHDFSVESQVTKQAEDLQQVHKKKWGGGQTGEQPHKGLKDRLPPNERERIMRYIYKNRMIRGLRQLISVGV